MLLRKANTLTQPTAVPRPHRSRGRASLDRKLTVWCASAVLSGGCAEGANAPDVTIEMFSWWVEPGEAEALDALLGVYRREHPDIDVINAAEINGESARERLEARFAEGFPPDTFQANVGYDLTRWISGNGMDAEQSKLEPLPDLFDVEDLTNPEIVPPELLESVSFMGVPYGVPVNIHRNNSLFYNKGVLERLELELPTSLAELDAVCDRIEAEDITCLSIGARDVWPLSLLFWSNVLIASAGPEYRRAFLAGEENPNDPELEDAALALFELWEHVDPEALELGWVDAVNAVGEGDAAFTVMGDWAKGLLVQDGFEPDEDFGQVAFPGTEDTFVFIADAFALSKGGPQPEATLALLEVMSSTEGQVEFNDIKGSIPVRFDAPTDDFDVLAQAMARDFREVEYRLIGAPGATPREFRPVEQYIFEALEIGKPELLINGVADYYSVLAR